MEERQILSKKDANDPSIGNIWEKQIVSELQHYSFTKTQVELITFEHIWEIDHFMERYKHINTLTSVPFPETGQYKIEIIVSPENTMNKITFYLLNKIKSHGSVYISVVATKMYNSHPNVTILADAKASLNMSDRICISSIMDSEFCHCSNIEPLIIYCKIQIPYQALHNSMCLPVLPAASLKTLESLNSYFDNALTSDNRTIKFKINKNKYYTLPKKLFRAINSSYFEHLYNTYKEDEKDITEELIEINGLIAFEQMLFFIITGSVPESANYQDLLKVANRYDVKTLKLICEQYLLKEINVNNAIDFMKLALSCDAKHLEKCVLSFIKFYFKRFKRIICTKAFQSLSQEHLHKLIELLAESKISETVTVVPLTSS